MPRGHAMIRRVRGMHRPIFPWCAVYIQKSGSTAPPCRITDPVLRAGTTHRRRLSTLTGTWPYQDNARPFEIAPRTTQPRATVRPS
jgi:hypothetical protein